MREIFGPLSTILAVLFALFILISEEANVPTGSGVKTRGESVSDLGDALLQTIMLRHQRQSDTRTIVKAQQMLQDDGFYLGPLDGSMTASTRAALRSFQYAKQLQVTGELDRETARELGLT